MLKVLIEKHLSVENIEACSEAVTDSRLNSSLSLTCSEEIQAVFQFLTEENFLQKNNFFIGCETVLKEICQRSNEDEVMFELLEVIETTKSDIIFTSALKGLQISILKQQTKKSRALDWVLDSIYGYVKNMPYQEDLINKCEDEEANLLEINDEINRILMMYLTLFLFVDPIHQGILADNENGEMFKDCNIKSKRNVLLSFLLKLFGVPFAFLEIGNATNADQINSKPYTLQCGETLVKLIATLLGDPHFLLSYVETRCQNSSKVDELKEQNIFKIVKKIPTLSIAIYYYWLYVQKQLPEFTPKIYAPKYIFETCLNLSIYLLEKKEATLVYKGISLADSLIEQLNNEIVKFSNCSSSVIHKFLTTLLNVIMFSNTARNRKMGVDILKKFIYVFDNIGRFTIIKFILEADNWKCVHGYISIIYKNLVADNLQCASMDPEFCGPKFHELFTKYVCHLKEGPVTDLMEYADKIMSALNIVRFFSMRDRNNQTGFWNFRAEVVNNFLEPLRKALDMSKAHYKAEELRLKSTDDQSEEDEKMFDVSILNDDGMPLPTMTKEQKVQALMSAFNTFDVMESLLAHANECISKKI